MAQAQFIETEDGLSVRLDPPAETMFLRKSEGYTPTLRPLIEELVDKSSGDEYERGYKQGVEDGKDEAECADDDES
jgi:hypothetical protein